MDEEKKEKSLETLEQELAEERTLKEEYLAGWQRCQADAANIRREHEKEQVELVQFASQRIMLELIDIVNIFHHAFSEKDENDPYTRGFRHIYNQLITLLQRHGVTTIEAQGQQFDSTLHEAIENISVSEKEKDTMVIEEMEKGYMLFGKVIKPAKVKVGEYKEN